MKEKITISFKLDLEVSKSFDKALERFQKITGVKPVKQDSYEMAIIEYTEKLNKMTDAIENKLIE